MAAEVPPELVDELYGAPADEFIARRDAKAKEVRKSDRALADAIKKLRRPSVSAAAVNRLARVASDDVDALLAAGEALRQAQFGGGERDAIRSAAADERDAVERLVTAAGRLSPAVAEEVRGTLHAAASDDETRELVRRGVLTEARRPAGFGGFGMGVAAPPPSGSGSGSRRAEGRVSKGARDKAARKSGSPGSAENAAAAEAEAEAERAAAEEAKRAAAEEAERKRAAKERVKAARAALREAEKEARAAERERERAAKALAKAEQAAEKAAAEVETRRAELESAESA